MMLLLPSFTVGPEQSGLVLIWTGSDRTGSNRTTPDPTGPDQIRPNWTGSDRTGPTASAGGSTEPAGLSVWSLVLLRFCWVVLDGPVGPPTVQRVGEAAAAPVELDRGERLLLEGWGNNQTDIRT